MMVFTYTLSIILMIVLPVIFAVIVRRRFQIPWLLFCVGMLTFIGSQVVHLPLNDWLSKLGWIPEQNVLTGAPLWRTALILGLSAGICEELARAAGYAILSRYRKFEHGVLLGLGHGGIEAMVFGGVLTAATFSSLWGLRGSDLSSLNLATDQLNALSQQLEMLDGSAMLAFTPLAERILAMAAHVLLSIIVLQAFSRRKWFFIPLAVLYHTLLDSLLIYVQYRWENTWLTYGIFLALLIPVAIWAISIAPRRTAVTARVSGNFLSELKIFWQATQKELVQQWRSKRIFVVATVFILFGMGSPLLAKFTPEIIKSVEGAEMFADMIPVPTTADAMAQYSKNLTQFGFILAILLGMGAVVGERERGTMAMILSKPMPRWAFICSKFAAQFLVYLLAFTVAGLGAYYYTLILFGPFDIGVFAAINFLLMAWLLVFVAVTLLASVIGGSTGAAAGIGFGLSVLLLLSGNIPRVGPLAPSGLIAWAGQLGADTASVSANGGALAMTFVLVLVCLLAALAVFERQEV